MLSALGAMAAETVAVAASAVAAGSLFQYNRENFLYDAEMRFERYVTGRQFAVQQQEQFRSDIRTLTSLTVKKNKMYAMIATLDMCLCVILYGSGRLGLHGPAPPGWVMALFLTNIAASFCFMAITIFLALHASFRAHAASVQLLTRKARVPVPSLKQLDRARKFASEFEQQDWGDIFRVPYLSNTGAPKTDNVVEAARACSVPPAHARRARNKAASWIRDEFDTDRAGTVVGPSTAMASMPESTPPEHFRLYAAVQKEWFQYEVYARVALFYGFRCLIHALAIYAIIHIIVELRAFWAAWTTAFVLECLHFFILKFEIVPGHNRHRKERLPMCEYMGHLTTLFASVAMALDFRVQFNMIAVGVTWAAVFIAYGCEITYQLRMLEVVLPDDVRTPFQTEDRIGSAWWPERWRVPSLFTHVLFFVAPPEQLQPGQHDIVREIKEGVGMDMWENFSAGSPGTGSDARKPLPSGNSREELVAKVQYVDRLFEWAFSNQVFESMSAGGKTKVRELYHTFAAARSAGPEAPALPQVLQDSLAGLESITAAEGLPAMNSNGYGSESEYDSPDSDYSTADGKAAAFQVRKLPKNPYPSPATQGPEPWRLVSLVQLVFVLSWVFLICTVVVDVILGDQALLNAPNRFMPPMTRPINMPSALGTPLGMPSMADSAPLIPEQLAWNEEHRTPGTTILNRPYNRRLSATAESAPAPELLRAAFEGLMRAVPDFVATPNSSPKSVPSKADISWPGFFEPQLLACGPEGAVAAITARGFGAVAKLQGGSEVAASFRLGGVGNLPSLLAANWGALQHEAKEDGLMLATNQGHLVACPGQPPAAGGNWPCHALKATPRLPIADGARLMAAAVAWLTHSSSPQLHAALVEESSSDMASIFALEGSGDSASWLPLGEIILPHSKSVSLSFVEGELLISTDAGHVIRRRVQDGSITQSHTHSFAEPELNAETSWTAACGRAQEGIAHLQLHRSAGGLAWRPELLTFGESKERRLQGTILQ